MRILRQSDSARAICHAEGRGFESLHPLLKAPVNREFLFAPKAATRSCCKRFCKRTARLACEEMRDWAPGRG
jgi:hypothetical protein